MTTETEQTLVDAAWPYWECERLPSVITPIRPMKIMLSI